jgi:hypothetical protein
MRQHLLFEDKYPPKFLVLISSKISKDIESIINYNRNNTEGIHRWCEYLDWVKDYLSNRAIAFDYANRYSRLPNGTYFLNDFNCGVGYTIKDNKFTKQPYVYIFMLNMKLEEFGLELPNMTESKNNTKIQYKMKQRIRLTEGDLHRIVRQCVNEALNELDARTYASYADKRKAQGQYNKAQKGRQAAVNAWNRDYSQGDYMDEFYHVKKNNWSEPNGITNVHRETYVPALDKTDHSLEHYDDDCTRHTDDVWRNSGYQGTNTKGAYVARQMANGEGNYIKGQGWR